MCPGTFPNLCQHYSIVNNRAAFFWLHCISSSDPILFYLGRLNDRLLSMSVVPSLSKVGWLAGWKKYWCFKFGFFQDLLNLFLPILFYLDQICWATSMPFASIYPTYQSMKFLQKHSENWRSLEMTYCFVFCYWGFSKNFFFVFSQWKSPWISYKVDFISALWMVSSESWKSLCHN